MSSESHTGLPSSRPATWDSKAPRKRSNLTLSLAQHPQQYTQLPFTSAYMGETSLGHRTRLITSAAGKPRSTLVSPPPFPSSSAPAAAAEPAVAATSADGTSDLHGSRTSRQRVSSLDCLQPRPVPRPHSANHRWVFLTQETLHPAFTAARGPSRVGTTADGGVVVAAANQNPARGRGRPTSGAAHVASSFTSDSLTRKTRETPVSLPLSVEISAGSAPPPSRHPVAPRREGRPPLAAHPPPPPTGASATACLDDLLANSRRASYTSSHSGAGSGGSGGSGAGLVSPPNGLDVEGDSVEVEPPAYLVDALARAARQGRALGFTSSAPSSLPDMACEAEAEAEVAAAAAPSARASGSASSRVASTHLVVPPARKPAEMHTLPPPATVSSHPRAAVLSDEERAAELRMMSHLSRPLSACPSASQRQGCAAPTGLLVDAAGPTAAAVAAESPRHRAEEEGGRDNVRARSASGWTEAEYAEAHHALRRVLRHVPAEQQSVLAQRLKTREQWCAEALHAYLPISAATTAPLPPPPLAAAAPAASPPPYAQQPQLPPDAPSSSSSQKLSQITPIPVGRPPTWTPARTTSRPSSVLSAPPLYTPGAVNAETDAAAPLLPLLGTISGSNNNNATEELSTQHQQLQQLVPPQSSDPMSEDVFLPSLANADGYSAALPSRVPPPAAETATAAVMDAAVLAELPSHYAQLLTRTTADRQAFEGRNPSLFACEMDPGGSAADRSRDSSGSGGSGAFRAGPVSTQRRDSANSATLPPWMSPPPPPSAATAATARHRVSLPFSPDEEVPVSALMALQGSGCSESSTAAGQPARLPLAPSRSSSLPQHVTNDDSQRTQGGSATATAATPNVRSPSRASLHFADATALATAAKAGTGLDESHQFSGSILTARTSVASASAGAVDGLSGRLPQVANPRGSRSTSWAAAQQQLVPRYDSDDASSEDSDVVAQRVAEANTSIAHYRQQLHGVITGETSASTTTPGHPSSAAASAAEDGNIVASGQSALDFTAQSRLKHLAARFEAKLSEAADAHGYTTPSERHRLLALADAFKEQRLQQIVSRLHPLEATEVSELDPSRCREQQQRQLCDEDADPQGRCCSRNGRRDVAAGAAAVVQPDASDVFPLTDAWRRADQNATAMDMFLLDLKKTGADKVSPSDVARAVESSVGQFDQQRSSRPGSRRRSSTAPAGAPPGRLSVFVSTSYRTNATVSTLLTTHERAVAQAAELQKAMENSFHEMLSRDENVI